VSIQKLLIEIYEDRIAEKIKDEELEEKFLASKIRANQMRT